MVPIKKHMITFLNMVSIITSTAREKNQITLNGVITESLKWFNSNIASLKLLEKHLK